MSLLSVFGLGGDDDDDASRGRPFEIDPYIDDFLDAMDELGVPVRIAEVKRTRARQDELYAQGRTAPGPVVTWTRSSKHLLGRAFDFDFVDADLNDDEEARELAGEVGEGLGLQWGGRWGVRDLRHFEV